MRNLICIRGEMMNIIEEISNYQPFNAQEAKDKALILSCLRNMEHVFSRDNKIAHMTASAWVVNRKRDKVLMAYHNIYDSWAWLGGHADGESDLLKVALRETTEESGIKNVHPVSEKIYSVEVLTVDGHNKHGIYVSSHLHLNVTYLLEAKDDERLSVKSDENSNVAWFTPEEAIRASTEEWFKENIYNKLTSKMRSRNEYFTKEKI